MDRDLLKSRIAKLPHLPAINPERHLEELDDEEEEALDNFPSESSFKKPRRRALPGVDYSPLSASGYFSTALQVDVPVTNVYASSKSVSPAATAPETLATFRVYYTPPPSPPPCTSNLLDPDDEHDGSGGCSVVFVCVHGAGYSGLSWACLAQELVEKGDGKVGVLAYDARGHGKTVLPPAVTSEVDLIDMSLEYMANDLVALLKAMYPVRAQAPSLILVGHSMGGAVVAEACNTLVRDVAEVAGIVVIDVVEGTAIEALSGMSALIAGQPKMFDSPEDAIAWHVESRTINNIASARVSVPPLLRPLQDGAARQGWRVDLQQTEPFWRGWFTGLSGKFLACRAAKLLLLAGTDRLDKDLLIGQMQGKYQLEIDPHVGHCVHEDAPGRTAETLLSFHERNQRVDLPQPLRKIP
ncbi:hypothetical protein JCM11641_001263 [Rhodosporidiobolus odoratus]